MHRQRVIKAAGVRKQGESCPHQPKNLKVFRYINRKVGQARCSAQVFALSVSQDLFSLERVQGYCQRAKLRARIKPTALCSALDKENSIEFPLDFLHYLYNYYMVCALFSHTYHVTSCDVTL